MKYLFSASLHHSADDSRSDACRARRLLIALKATLSISLSKLLSIYLAFRMCPFWAAAPEGTEGDASPMAQGDICTYVCPSVRPSVRPPH